MDFHAHRNHVYDVAVLCRPRNQPMAETQEKQENGMTREDPSNTEKTLEQTLFDSGLEFRDPQTQI